MGFDSAVDGQPHLTAVRKPTICRVLLAGATE